MAIFHLCMGYSNSRLVLFKHIQIIIESSELRLFFWIDLYQTWMLVVTQSSMKMIGYTRIELTIASTEVGVIV